MEDSQRHGPPARSVDGASCRCSKSDLKMNKGAPFLENAVTKIQERRGDLASRQKYLKEKISALERSLPAIMAFNMWKSGNKDDDPPLRKIRQIVNKISPHTDPTEKLVDNLKETVNSLNMETAELHDKIIAADINLEESQMELESLELENKEFDDALKKLEKGVNKEKTPSLHSIHSEDIFCLAKIRQLGEEEINLKNSIRELEERETIFQEQINRVLTSREFQKSVSKDLSCGRKTHSCLVHTSMSNVQDTRKKIVHKPKEVPTGFKEKCPEGRAPHKEQKPKSAGTSGTRNVEILEPATTKAPSTREENCERQKSSNFCVPSSCPAASKASTSGVAHGSWKASPSRNVLNPQQVSQSSRHFTKSFCSTKSVLSSKDRGCSACCKNVSSPSTLTTKTVLSSRDRGCSACCKNVSSPIKSPCKMSIPSTSVQWKCCKGKTCCPLTPMAKQSPSTICKKCQGWIHQTGDPASRRVFTCKGKCADLRSEQPCDCAAYLENLDDDEGHEHPSESAGSTEQSSTDEEYCECCDCGCNDSDFSSDSCQF